VSRYSVHILLAVLIFLAFDVPSAFSRDVACVEQIEAEDLNGRLGNQESFVITGGDDVTFRLSHGRADNVLVGPATAWMRISVLEKGHVVKELPDSYYLGYSFLKSNGSSFWMIGEYTGGAHCCARYHFFARPAPGRQLRYLGATQGSSEGLAEAPFVCRDGAVYFTDADIRFLYFHTPYSQSILAIPTYYRIGASSLTVDNRPFKKYFLAAVQDIENEIPDVLRKRSVVPQSILLDDDSHFFSDELGQLLVKRTILYLYAREDRKAWATFDRDVRKYYGTRRNLEQIKYEIGRTLKDSAY
jgi:hypothetical protein